MSDQELFSALSLEEPVLKALAEMGYKTMTPVQAGAIPHLLSGMDFLGQAPTGTGKTAAFGVPIVSRLQPGSGNIQALIVGPTRELVQQISAELSDIGKYKGIKTIAVYGGESVFGQKDRLREMQADIVVGTPGRLIDLLEQVALDFSKTRWVVLDEADEMLDMGFVDDIEKILSYTPRGRQTCLFSATISKEIRRIVDRYLMYPEEIRIQPQTTSATSITQYYFVLEEDDKPALLKKILKDNEDFYGIVFCQTKKGVVDLTRKLRDRYPVECIHGALPQHMRDTAMEDFRQKKFKMLVATDVMARGIDIDNLTHIINYNPPDDPESYIHRIGRTARAGETGTAITLFLPYEREEFDRLQKRVGMGLTAHPDNAGEFKDSGRPPSSRRGYGKRPYGGQKNQPRNKARRNPSGGGGGGSRGGGGRGGNRGGGR